MTKIGKANLFFIRACRWQPHHHDSGAHAGVHALLAACHISARYFSISVTQIGKWSLAVAAANLPVSLTTRPFAKI